MIFNAFPSTANPAIKNVLFIISDDLKASVMGCYGSDVGITPNIDKLAASGMVFDRAYCQGIWCAPSRQSFMFSRYVDKKGVNMGEFFRNNGYYSARVGKIYHMRVPGDIIDGTDGADVPSSWSEKFNSPGREAHTPGDYACLNLNIFTDKEEGRQSTAMPHRMFVTVQYDGDGSDQPDHKTATKAIDLLRNHKEKPFFLGVGMVRPHYPMVAPRKYFKQYDWKKIKLPHVPPGDTDDIPKIGWATSSLKNSIGKYPDNQKRMWEAYFATVTFMDEQVGRVIDELEQLGLRENTAVVFTSDHGYHLGEHTFWQKHMFHEEVARVPLIISVPGLKPGRSSSFVELLDIYPTMAGLAGLKVGADVQGLSLLPVLKDPSAAVRDAALSVEKKKGWALRSRKWAYMRYKNGEEELYNMHDDPQQYNNQAENPEYAEYLKERRSAMDCRLKAAEIEPKKSSVGRGNAVVRRIPVKAAQGVAVDKKYFYAISNTKIVKCERKSVKVIATWKADIKDEPYKHFKHMNSGTVIDGKLYCAHSRYSVDPNDCTVEIWDVKNEKLNHIETIHMPRKHGSLTWIDIDADGAWWMCYAVYGKNKNKSTKLVKYEYVDNEFKEVDNWFFPAEVISKWGEMSCSGGSWGPDGYLYTTGHDDAVVHLLKFGKTGTLQYVRTEKNVGLWGQAFAWDRTSKRPIIWGIDKSKHISLTLISAKERVKREKR